MSARGSREPREARPSQSRVRWDGDVVMLALTLLGLLVGGIAHLTGHRGAGDVLWALTTAGAAVVTACWVVAAALRRQLGVDVLALLALAGTLMVDEYLAGSVIAVMLATGRSLEAWAAGRANRELRRLVERAPRIAHRRDADTTTDVPVAQIAVGDLLLVKPGEVVPVDGHVVGGPAVIDESALTGEPLPVEHAVGELLRSGTVNVGGPIELRAATTSADSTYAGIVDLVASAQTEQAPAVRLADRYALWFLALGLTVAVAAGVAAGELSRTVAVLVVATPCPLILAVPVALVSGLSLTARRGVVVKGGGPLERLAASRVLLFDKTGTLTAGQPALVAVRCADGGHGEAEALRLAASLDQLSPHVLAGAVVRAAAERQLPLSVPEAVEEVPGHGIRGVVEGHQVAVGKRSWIGGDAGWLQEVRRRADRDSQLTVFVGVDGKPEAVLLFADRIRPDAARTIRRLRKDGIEKIIMVTGDRTDVAETVGAAIGVDQVLAEQTPEQKLEAVTAARRVGPTVMVGDGINDAPALALADVGVAIAARGATASSEAADVVLNVDRLDRVGDAIVIARRCRRIAVESVFMGIGLSIVAMGFAAVGLLPATWGAISQEAIDVAAILNALRALTPGNTATSLDSTDSALAGRFAAEHRTLRPELDRLREAADAIGVVPENQAVEGAARAHRWLAQELWPHEQNEDIQLYPMLDRVLGGPETTATMSRAHTEIAQLIRQLGRTLEDLGPDPAPADVAELRHLLYGLHAILTLHFAQEDENYLSLADDDPDPRRATATHHPNRTRGPKP